MATPGAIAAIRDTATKNLSASLVEIAQVLNTTPPEIPLYNRSQDYLHADQLRVLSEFLAEITPAIVHLVENSAEAKEVSEPLDIPAYSDITKARIIEDLQALGFDPNERDNKDVLYAQLQDAFAGVTNGDPDTDGD